MEKDNVESNMKPRFLADRLGVMGLVVRREREIKRRLIGRHNMMTRMW